MSPELEHALALLLTGGLVLAAILLKWLLQKVGIPALVGYLLLGFLLRSIDSATAFLTSGIVGYLGFLADLGVAALLLRVGLESDLGGLLGQFRRAQGIWIGNVALSTLVGFWTAFSLLGFPLITSLYITVALTATSVAIPVAVWREADVLESPNGALLLDVAELDDISAIALMSLLFAVVPAVASPEAAAPLPKLLIAGGLLLLKLFAFGGLCYAFSRFAERPMTRFFERIEPMPDPMLMLAATGVVIAALSGMLGFSIALGAFFAGLLFSRDPEAVTLSRPFSVLYDLFTPFFFISLGLHLDVSVAETALVPGAVLLAAAVIGKLAGTIAPAVPAAGWRGSVLLGLSMVPRAEIAMVVMNHGLNNQHCEMSEKAFAAMVLVSAGTCLVAPLALRPLLARWPQVSSSPSQSE